MIAVQRLPELSHIEDIEGYSVFVTMGGRVGVAFRLPTIDLESRTGLRMGDIDSLIKDSPPGVLLRFNVKQWFSNEALKGGGGRGECVSQIGHVQRSLVVSFEDGGNVPLLQSFSKKGWSVAARRLINGIPIGTIEALGGIRFTESEVAAAFDLGQSQYEKRLGLIDRGPALLGSVRIYEPKKGVGSLSSTWISEIMGGSTTQAGGLLTLPLEISVTLKKIGKHRTELQLRSKLNQAAQSNDPLAIQNRSELQESLERTELAGDDQVEVEWIALLERTSENALRTDRERVRKALSEIGSCCLETSGIEQSFIATRLGASQHVTFREFRSQLGAYLPIHYYGESSGLTEPPSGAIVLHRLDETACSFDLFDRRNHNFNGIIIGESGSGKSVFIGLVTFCLYEDPRIKIIKCDVGGSYGRECKRLGGEQIDFELSHPSGLDPFKTVVENTGISENDAAQVLATLVAVLLKEQDERRIPELMLAEIEALSKDYIRTARACEIDPGIDSFYEMTGALSRRALLKRWITGGVYENVFRRNGKESGSTKYIYYNFKDIFNAASPTYADGIMAAVMAEINLEIINAGLQSKERICLICDEVKFFISRHYETFDLLAANFRKFGHSLVIVIQDPANIEQANPKLRHGDDRESGLWVNLQTKVFLKTNLSADSLKRRGLTDLEIRSIEEQPGDKTAPRHAVIQDGSGSKIVKLIQTKGEYWRTTSDKQDNELLQNLLEAVPGLSVDQAIGVLIATGAGGGV